MPTRWMAYTLDTGWGELTERQGIDFRESLRKLHPRLAEGCKLVCIPDFKLSDMKRPVMLVSKDFDGKAFCEALNAAKVDFPPIPIEVSPYLPSGTIAFIETATPPPFMLL